MKFTLNQFYHVYNRGNNKKPIFFSRENYLLFLRKMRRHVKGYSKIIAYCLMPNHFHWLIFVENSPRHLEDVNPLNQQIGTLLSSYTQALNNRYDRTGSIFQQSTQSILIDSRLQALACFHYIHQNPIRAGLVNGLGEWPYSSLPDYSGRRNGTLVDKDVAFQKLDINPDEIIEQSKQTIPGEIIKKLY